MTGNVVVVVDASGSMGTPMRGTNTDRMSVAKDALKQVLGQGPTPLTWACSCSRTATGFTRSARGMMNGQRGDRRYHLAGGPSW